MQFDNAQGTSLVRNLSCWVLCLCLKSLQLGQCGAGKGIPNHITIANLSFKKSFIDLPSILYGRVFFKFLNTSSQHKP